MRSPASLPVPLRDAACTTGAASRGCPWALSRADEHGTATLGVAAPEPAWTCRVRDGMELIGWQICRPHECDGQGKACAEDGGRWSSRGRALVYLSEHPALAVLEARVHLDIPHEEMAHDHLLLRVRLPGDSVEDLAVMPADPVAHGDAWLREGRSAVLRVPSIVVQEGRNLLLNPEHPDGGEARVITATPFRFDRRLWGGI